MRKAVLSLIIISAVLTASAAYAGSEAIIEFDKNDRFLIAVRGTADPESAGCAYIMKENTDAENIDLNNLSDGVLDFKRFTADSNGNFETLFYMDGHDCNPGKYNVYADYNLNGNAVKDSMPNVRYIKAAERSDLLEGINQALLNGTMPGFVSDNKDTMLTDEDITEKYISDSVVQKEVTDIISDMAPYESYKNFLEDFNKYGAYSIIRNASAAELETVLPKYRFYLGYDISSYDNLPKYKEKAYEILSQRDFSDTDEMCMEIEQAVYVAAAQNCTRWGELWDLLFNTYGDVFNLDKSLLGNTDKAKVFGVMLDKRPFYSAADISDKYKMSIEQVQKENNVSPGGLSPGGSSSGSAPSGFTGAPAVTPAKQNETFSDMAQAEWAKEFVEKLAALNIVSGIGDGTFAPQKLVTRGEFSTMLAKALNLSADNLNNSYEDVFETDWFCPYVAALSAKGVASGAYGKFYPYNNITRQDMASMIWRALKMMGYESADKSDVFPMDYDDVAEYAKEGVAALYGMGIISGFEDNSFRGGNTATRAETAVVLCKLLEFIN